MKGLKPEDYRGKNLLFVTGKLAAPMLRRVVADLAAKLEFGYSVEVLPITVAALMTTDWVARKLPEVPSSIDLVILPGYCHGPLEVLTKQIGRPILRGPSDLRRLPEMFGRKRELSADYELYDIEILAEINHAPKMPIDEVVSVAKSMLADGADIIDLGCIPNDDWQEVGDYVKALRDLGARVSIDSFSITEIERAIKAGAEQVLSVNQTNREAARDWGCQVVVVPDTPDQLDSMDATVEYLVRHDVDIRLDPILEPIGCGFSNSLGRYLETRRRYPELPMMMGIGNLTELTDVDSAGINVLLLGFCQEQRIHQVLTTQVIQWAQSSVRECDLARRLVRESIRNGIPPKHIEPRLVLLRDAIQNDYGQEAIDELQQAIKDNNYRIIADNGAIHLLSSEHQISDIDPFMIFDQLAKTSPRNLNLSHAFYLGFEMCKAATALTLNKEYRQDQALDWGFLTQDEADRHRFAFRRTEDKRTSESDLDSEG